MFAPDRAIPQHVAAKLQRWSLILASYKYTLEYRNTHSHQDADCMSRIPLPKFYSPKSENSECLFVDSDFEIETNVTSDRIRKATRTDQILSQVLNYIVHGWPTVTDLIYAPYRTKKDELSTLQGCVLWGSRVIIPKTLQNAVLEELHATHPGMTRMKELARSYVWWPNINVQIQEKVSDCEICSSFRNEPLKSQIHPWSFATKPWSRVHIDFAGPVNNAIYLVIVDSYSKFPEVVKMSSTTSSATISVLRETFARYGLPKILVSDNGPQFKSAEFEQFCVNNGILHCTSAVYKPATNGQAERAVQILKNSIKRAKLAGKNVDEEISECLLRYRVTPHATTGEAPSVLLMGRKIRTKLDLILPSVNSKVEKSQNRTVMSTDRLSREFDSGDNVLVRNYSNDEKWKTGTVHSKLGDRHYLIDMEGNVVKRHIDQLLEKRSSNNDGVQEKCELPVSDTENLGGKENVSADDVYIDSGSQNCDEKKEIPDHNANTNYRPSRVKKQPSYLKDYICK